ncbi:O-methyltransferase [Lutispora saccharofermentans]|uniref:O-methyltransferase n=1 Tax=Lutispora saccharofermentans TaxID=3024236 RepID=A0ABT1NG50_9FIRM|nr:O-methyltransferase [Lutispora saccharofermentans]MCQ1530212.1 O-methyltransferase [Lutispora saccharofermentans]
MDFLKVNNYIEELYSSTNKINRKTYQDMTELKDFIPVVDDDVARYLKILIMIKRPKRILEIGTSIGYSTTSMATAVKSFGGKITTVEYDEKVAKQAKDNFERAGISDYIEILIGDAKEIVPELEGGYDLIFQDADKRLYPELYKECIRLLNPDGIFIAEDTLFPVIDLDEKWHYLIPSIEEFNKLVVNDSRVDSTIIPIGDGVTVIIKK